MASTPPGPQGKGADPNGQQQGHQPQEQEIELGVINQFNQFHFFPQPSSKSQGKATSSASTSLVPSSDTSKSSGTDAGSPPTPKSHDTIQPVTSRPPQDTQAQEGVQPPASEAKSSSPTPQQNKTETGRGASDTHDWITPESFSTSATAISTPIPGSGSGKPTTGLGLTLPSSKNKGSKDALSLNWQDGAGISSVSAPPLPPGQRFPLKKASQCTVTTMSTSRSGGEDDRDDGVTWTEAEEKKLVKKLDWCFLPTVWLMALMSWMDRSSIGNAQLAGMGDDLGLSSEQYSMVIVVFYFGYVTCGPLSNLILSRTLPRYYLPGLVGAWGALTLSMAFVNSYPFLLMLRFFVGVFESGLSPATIFLISCWYRPEEQGKRISATLSAALLGGAFGGMISGGAAAWLEGVRNVRGWKWLFIIEGIFTMIWATISYWLMIDFPGSRSTVKRFGERGQQIAVGRVKKAGILLGRLEADGSLPAVGENQKLGKVESMRIALSDLRVWAITIGVGLLGCSTVLAYFYPILVYEMGFKSITETQFMTIPIWTAAVVCAVGSGYLADQHPHQRALMMAIWMGMAAIFSIIVCIVHVPVGRYVLLLFMAGGVWSSIAGYLSLLTVTFSNMHPEARAFALALPGAVGNLGNVYGAYLFPGRDMPDYEMGFGVIAGTLALGAVVFLVFHLFWRRRRLLNLYE